jgi:hypothetical protein
LASTTPTKLVSRYSTFAGSPANAESLVNGLQSGSSITLVPRGAPGPAKQAVSFTSATTHLGLGEVNITLALAKAELSKLGISKPTPEQLQAALNGGTLTAPKGTRVTLIGVLAQRQSGQGWGHIAKSMGVHLGSVVSASKTGHTQHASFADAGDKSSHAAAATHAGGNGGGNGGGKGSGGGGGKK